MTGLVTRFTEVLGGRRPAEFARLIGVSRSSVTQWLKGDIKSLKAVTAMRIEEATGYSARWLVLNEGPPRAILKERKQKASKKPTQDHHREYLTSDEFLLLQSFRALDPDGRAQVVRYVEERLALLRAKGGGAIVIPLPRHHKRK